MACPTLCTAILYEHLGWLSDQETKHASSRYRSPPYSWNSKTVRDPITLSEIAVFRGIAPASVFPDSASSMTLPGKTPFVFQAIPVTYKSVGVISALLTGASSL